MAQKIFDVEGVGPVVISKRRGSKNMRLSITAKGQVRVNLPYWTPYSMGLAFISSRAEWIKERAGRYQKQILRHNDRIGKSYRLNISHNTGVKTISARIRTSEIIISAPPGTSESELQKKIHMAAEKALKREAQKLLPQRVSYLAKKHGYSYSELQVKKLTSRWGSCSSSGKITLSYFLMQLPWELIDYVILHELTHTRHLNHSASFWSEFKQALPNVKELRKQIKQHNPVVKATI
jgi:predicted metal-dependent hydrolase